MAGEHPTADVSSEFDPWLLRVVDLKQFDYCPRVVYYQYCLPGLRPTTYKMAAGIAAQDKIETLEPRRSLRAYGLADGKRHFNVPLVSAALGCTGQVDMVLETGNPVHGQPTATVLADGAGKVVAAEAEGAAGELVPIDFKLSRKAPGRHFKLQLACYGLMLEERWQKPVARGFIYLIPTKRAVLVEITTRLRNDARRKLTEIRTLIRTQRTPPPTKQRAKCVECEFRRFCNDVV